MRHWAVRRSLGGCIALEDGDTFPLRGSATRLTGRRA
jgi:hypothetical protein